MRAGSNSRLQALMYLRKRRREGMKDIVTSMLAKRGRVSTRCLYLRANFGRR